MNKPAVITFAKSGVETAERVALLVGGILYHDVAPALLPRLFGQGTPVIGVCAAGILIRLLAPYLADKHSEPPVIAVSPDGAHVVPLLGGHHGANALAHEIAEGLGGIAAVTTASEARFGRALDDPPPGWVLANPAAAKDAMAALLAGAKIALDGNADWLAAAGYALDPQGSVRVTATDRRGNAAGLVFHPKTLIAGVGCERGTTVEEVVALIDETLLSADLAGESLAAIGTIDIKADEAGILEAARRLGVPIRLFTSAELAAEGDRLPNPSAVVEAEIGIPGVAEAVALKAGELIVPKRKSKRATCAIGRSPAPLDVASFGRPPGHLHVVGVGPGEPNARTAAAVAALDAATEWVGYGLYLDLVADLRRAQVQHRYDLGDEEVRVRHALELAATGKTVALVSSGDAQIYAMAALVYELIDADGERALGDAARRVAVTVHPGVSALQAASAGAGALIGHDFCAISLSDLLTPREDIVQRLAAAASGDFVTALYNPRSQRRTDLIEAAHALFLAHRPVTTPVVVGSNLGRPAERLTVTTLAEFDPASVDMLTVVLIGSSQSRRLVRGSGEVVAYTPRGYDRKMR